MAIPLIPANQPKYTDPDVSLDQALDMFRQTTQRAALTNALMDADQKVKTIQDSALKEQEKMAAMNEIARGLTFNMLRSGQTAASIEQATGTIKQPRIQSADEAILRGTLAGDPELVKKGVQADFLSASNKLAAMRGGGGKPLTSGEVDKIQAFEAAQVQLQDLMGQVQSDSSLVGPLAGRIPGRGMVSPEFAAFKQNAEQFFNAYRQQITGAGASTQELNMLRAATPSVTDRPDVFLSKAKAAMDVGNKIKSRYLQNLRRAGRDMSEFSVQEQEAAAAKATSKGAAPAWQSYVPRGK